MYDSDINGMPKQGWPDTLCFRPRWKTDPRTHTTPHESETIVVRLWWEFVNMDPEGSRDEKNTSSYDNQHVVFAGMVFAGCRCILGSQERFSEEINSWMTVLAVTEKWWFEAQSSAFTLFLFYLVPIVSWVTSYCYLILRTQRRNYCDQHREHEKGFPPSLHQSVALWFGGDRKCAVALAHPGLFARRQCPQPWQVS